MHMPPAESMLEERPPNRVTLFLCGDVMLGRGIDQILPHPSEPRLFEGYMSDARDYVRLAERRCGLIPRAGFEYVWGDALPELERVRPDARIINLETSITTSNVPEWKGINYRMHPDNVACLTAAGIDCCVLANNHVLDWSEAGLIETLVTLHRAGLRTAGAGRQREQAEEPAVLALGGAARLLVFAFALPSSGVAAHWAAGDEKPGVCFLPDLSSRSLERVALLVERHRRPGDVTLISLHWGGNWGYEIPAEQRHFARQLIDEVQADVVHGHSSHHAKGIEVYRSKPILYGCGDFINDYEGIEGHESFRGGLPLMYFVELELGTQRLVSLEMSLLELRRFQLRRAAPADVEWMARVLSREGRPLGTHVRVAGGGALQLEWGKEEPRER